MQLTDIYIYPKYGTDIQMGHRQSFKQNALFWLLWLTTLRRVLLIKKKKNKNGKRGIIPGKPGHLVTLFKPSQIKAVS